MAASHELIKEYMFAVKACMDDAPHEVREKIQGIIDADINYIDHKVNIEGLAYPDPGIMPVVRHVIRPDHCSEMDLCVIKYLAIGTAVAAAWVSSGGRLAVGSMVEGVVMTEVMVNALRGGASGVVIAKLICE
jgi:hypothetical protein